MAAAAVVKGAWVYAAVAVMSIIFGMDGNPISWVAAITAIGLSLIVARTLAVIVMPGWAPYAIQMVAGTILIYLTIATQLEPGGLGWISSVSSDTVPVGYAFSVGLAVAFLALLWWLGGRLSSVENPVEQLSTDFRIGILVLGLAAFADAFHPANLSIYPLMFVFFAAGLGGLSVGYLLPASSGSAAEKAWPRIISAVVGLVIVAGLLFSFLGQRPLNFIAAPIKLLLDAVITVFLVVVVIPMAYVMEIVLTALFRLFAKLFGGGEPEELELTEGIGELLSQFRDEAADTGQSMIVQVIEWSVLAVVVLVVLYVLSRAFRRRIRWLRIDQEGARESLSEDVDPAVDLARLLLNLVPDRFRKRKAEYRLQLPDDESEIVDVFRVYFGMLMLAEDRGRHRRASQTPTEYQTSLERVFPRNVVQQVTAAFNRACYGHQPASRAEIDEMRGALEQATAESTG